MLRVIMVDLVFINAGVIPRSVRLEVPAGAVLHFMAWYGAYFAGDRYSVVPTGRNVPMDASTAKLKKSD